MASVHELKDPVFHQISIGVVVTLSHDECVQASADVSLLALGVPDPYASVLRLSGLAFSSLDQGNGLDIHVVLVPVQLVVPYPR